MEASVSINQYAAIGRDQLAIQTTLVFDVLQAAVSDFEIRRRKILPMRARHSNPQCRSSAPMHGAGRMIFKGGWLKGRGRYLCMAGRIMRASVA
jgi:hypothetical protein